MRFQKTISAEGEKKLLEPYLYITENPGKGVRSMMMKALNHWLAVPEDKLTEVATIVEMLHNASLLIDDIEDNSKLRRGKPAAHIIYGEAIVINCANYVYFLAQKRLLALGNPELLIPFTEELLNLHRGQGMEIVHRNSSECPTEDEYLLMVSNKTGGLMRMAVKLMMGFAQKKPSGDLLNLVDLLGIHFQVRDDYLNLASDQFMETKGLYEDITEGKFSFPILHSIHADPAGSAMLIDILSQGTEDIDLLRKAVDHIKGTGSFEYSKNYLTQLEAHIRDEIAKLGGNEIMTAIVNKLSTSMK